MNKFEEKENLNNEEVRSSVLGGETQDKQGREERWGIFPNLNSNEGRGEKEKELEDIDRKIDYDSETPLISEDETDDEEELHQYSRQVGFIKPYEISEHYCFHKQRKHCACMYWLRVKRFSNLKHRSYLFGENAMDDLTAIHQELSLAPLFKNQKLISDHYSKHHVVILALEMEDHRLINGPSKTRPEFLNLLYRIREFYGDDSDHGEKPVEGMYEAQGFTDSVADIWNSIKDLFMSTWDKLETMIDKTIGKLMDCVKAFVGLVSTTLGTIMDKILKQLSFYVVKHFDPVKFCKEGMSNVKVNTSIIIFMAISVFLILQMIFYKTINIATRFIDRIFEYFTTQKEEESDEENDFKGNSFYAQGPGPDPLAAVIAVIGILYGLKTCDLEAISKKARFLTTIVAAGCATSFVASSLFLCLPSVFTDAIKLRFGTETQRESVLMEDWLVKSNAVIRLRKIPKVLTSDEYYSWVTDLLAKSGDLRRQIKSAPYVQLFMRNMATLTEIITILSHYRAGKSTRDMPHSLHVAGDSGVGKTLVITRLFKDVYGIVGKDVWPRPVSSQHWDGFVDQKAVHIDEFLIGDVERRNLMASEYLALVSTQTFRPALASTDDPLVGLKGTDACPLAVITSNNSCYATQTGFEKLTLWRRRRFVLRFRIHTDFQHVVVKGNIDFSKLTSDQIRDISWLAIDILPPVPSKNEDILNLSYSDLVTILRDDFEKHKAICSLLREGVQGNLVLEKTPQQFLDDAIRDLRGIPNEEIGIKDSILNFFSEGFDVLKTIGIFSAQSPDETDPAPAPDNTQGMDESVGNRLYSNELKRAVALEKEILKIIKKISRTKSPDCNKDRMHRAMDKFTDLTILRADVSGRSPDDIEAMELRTTRYNNIRNILFNKCNALGMAFNLPSTSDDTSDTTSEEYYDMEKVQRDEYIATIDHDNVDPAVMHRHTCIGGQTVTEHQVTKVVPCGRHLVHAHEDRTPHELLCRDCKRRGIQEDHRFVYAEPSTSFIGLKINRLPDILPEDIDYEYPGETPEVRDRINAMWLKMASEKFFSYTSLSMPYLPGTYTTDPSNGQRIYDMETTSVGDIFSKELKKTAKMTLIAISIYVAVKGAQRLLFKNEEDSEVVCFAQSQRPGKETRNARTRRTYRRPTAQGPDFAPLKFEIDDMEFTGIPISGFVFMTYYHALLNKTTLELRPEGLPFTVTWKGKRETMAFQHDWIRADPESDIAFVRFRSKLPAFPDISRKFWNDSDVELFTTGNGLMKVSNGIEKYIPIAKVNNKRYNYGKKVYSHNEVLMYRANTVVGDCGSLVFSMDKVSPGKIIGMHVAGGNNGLTSYGMAIIITQEDIQNALKSEELSTPEEVDFTSQGPPSPFEGPNCRHVSEIGTSEQVHICRKTKLQPSALSGKLTWDAQKVLPILSKEDPRSGGIDPMISMINDTCQVNMPEIDLKALKLVADEQLHRLKQTLRYPIGQRELTFEEALAGIPGLLSSMKIGSSPGYPLCKVGTKKGKRSFFYFDEEGKLVYEQFFKDLVMRQYDIFKRGEMDCGRFVAYLKDELISKAKESQGRTRIIYCGDLIANTVFRMAFGHLLVAFNNSYGTTSSCIGLNQYSYDMQLIYEYLIQAGNHFVAGDFKNFDKHQQKDFQMAAYGILMDLASDEVDEMAKASFVVHQTQSPAQYDKWLINFKTVHYSGCFFTTIYNDIVHELYVRYMFYKKCPNEIFEQKVRIKTYGDDHIYCFSQDVCEYFTPLEIGRFMETIGQIYTAADKDSELTDSFPSFKELTFLGAHPRRYDGQWVGAMSKKTIQETMHWTRTKDVDVHQRIALVVEMASQWGWEYYDYIVGNIRRAMKELCVPMEDQPSCGTCRRIVASRIAGSSSEFPYGFFAQGPDLAQIKPAVIEMPAGQPNSLVQLNPQISNLAVPVASDLKMRALAMKALNEEAMDLEYGTRSDVFRTQVEWKTTQQTEEHLLSVNVPYGLLALGDADNVQNMPFDRFAFWEGNVEVTFQLNGNQFQQGLLVAYFVPLADYKVELSNITTCQYIFMQPDQSSTTSIHIPFLYFRSVMNTMARGTESLGTLHLAVYSPLTAPDNEPITVSVFTKFPDSKFTIPRPLATQERIGKFYEVNPVKIDMSDVINFSGNMQAQGGVQSTSITNQYINSGAGSMPVQGVANSANPSQTIEQDMDATIPMPFDNPPLASGAIPIQQQFSGMANSIGIRPTVDMQLAPVAFSRQQTQIFDPAETKLSTLCGKRCLLTRFTWKKDDPKGTELWKVNLNTRFGLAQGKGIPLNVAIINQFMFWRADVELTFVCVRTQFHSGRLMLVKAYGAPNLTAGSNNVNYSSVMTFSRDKYVNDEKINFNAQTEFLRTYEGEKAIDPVQNYSLATVSLQVLNQLVSPETVAPDVDLLLFIRFGNLRLAVPRGIGPFSWNGYQYIKRYGGTLENTTDSFKDMTAPPEIIEGQIIWKTNYADWVRTGDFITLQIMPTSRYKTTMTISVGGNLRSEEVTLTNFWINGSGAQYGFTTEPVIPIPEGFTLSGSFIEIQPGSKIRYASTEKEELGLIGGDEIVMSAQGPEETEPTTERIEMAPTQATTMNETKLPSNIPCRLNLGEKFEFTISDIHEVARRYIRLEPITNEALDQFTIETQTRGAVTYNHVNAGVQPQSIWRGLYAAWAGSVKYRAFSTAQSHVTQATFVPFMNVGVYGLPLIDAMSGNTFIFDGLGLSSSSAIGSCNAREVFYPMSATNFIDISCPFQSHFNFCFNSRTQDIAPISSGTVTVSSTGEEVPIIFTAFGDDLRLGIFRPPRETRFDLTGFTNGIGGFD